MPMRAAPVSVSRATPRIRNLVWAKHPVRAVRQTASSRQDLAHFRSDRLPRCLLLSAGAGPRAPNMKHVGACPL